MPAIPAHHTDTVDEPWDGPAEEALIADDAGEKTLRLMYAWVDPAADADTKAAYKFPHHDVGEAGEAGEMAGKPGAANMDGCRSCMSGITGADIPESDRAGVEAHLQAHLDDAMPADDMMKGSLVTPRSYGHVARTIHERPWAVQPATLKLMSELVHSRIAGFVPSEDEIAERLAAAKAQNGERCGGYQMGQVAVLTMYGIISQRTSMMQDFSGGCSVDGLRNSLREALADPSVSAIVFDIDSPGGSTDGIPEFAAELRAARQGRKPIVGVANTLCASAAYWLAANMSELVVTPSGEVGSIGVYAMHEDDSAALEMQGVKMTLISAGAYKVDGNSYTPLTDTARAYLQGQIDEFYGMFLADVARGRRTNADNVGTNFGQGRTLLARQALAAGMVDRIDTLETTAARLQPKPAGSRTSAAVTSLKPAALAASVGRPDPGWNRRMKGRVR